MAHDVSIEQSVGGDGRAWQKFQAICEAQGGMRELPASTYTDTVEAPRDGSLAAIDNRRLAKAAKLAGAPLAPAAGLELFVRLGDRIARGQPLFTLYAQSPGVLEYALDYVRGNADILSIAEGSPPR